MSQPVLRDKQVLIIEDDQLFAEALAELLKINAMRVQTCGTVAQALAKLANQRFDVVVLDLNLERGVGETIVETLRRDKAAMSHQTPILVISGFLDPSRLASLPSGGVQGALVKPFDEGELVRRLAGLLLKR